jgi:deoxyhypusine monooxygenase
LVVGLECGSVLFRHEIAFVLGQLQSPLTVPALIKVVENKMENEIVRHESIEALGSIGTNECMEVIRRYITDDRDLVRESCEVALDMCDYENSIEFQYANGLEMVTEDH